ncbi:acyl carrier protein [Pontibacterium sp.]|uniref:acyl carrier protein n=1 Tax=Pontibacterium sp. TaxID=2036026 RepID=UPI003511FC0B
MEIAQIEVIVFEELQNIAPELVPSELDRDEDLREELDIDSMDFMILMVALGKRLGIKIPDQDHHLLTSLNNLLGYLQEKSGQN